MVLVAMLTPLFLTLVIGYGESLSQCLGSCVCSETDEELSVDCNDKNLFAVPELFTLDRNNKKINLYLNRNSIKYILQNHFWPVRNHLKSLEVLENTNELTLGPYTFAHLSTSLESLKIGPFIRTQAHHDDSLLFEDLVNVKDLYVRCSDQGSDALKLPKQPSALRTLHMHWCRIIEPGISDTDLVELRLNNNKLFRFPAHIKPLLAKSLERLHLDENYIFTLRSGDIPRDCQLKRLSLRKNGLKAIEEGALEHCSNLQELDISGNPAFVKMASSILQGFSHLKLDISYTGIKGFDFIPSGTRVTARGVRILCGTCEIITDYMLKTSGKAETSCWHEARKQYITFEQFFKDECSYNKINVDHALVSNQQIAGDLSHGAAGNFYKREDRKQRVIGENVDNTQYRAEYMKGKVVDMQNQKGNLDDTQYQAKHMKGKVDDTRYQAKYVKGKSPTSRDLDRQKVNDTHNTTSGAKKEDLPKRARDQRKVDVAHLDNVERQTKRRKAELGQPRLAPDNKTSEQLSVRLSKHNKTRVDATESATIDFNTSGPSLRAADQKKADQTLFVADDVNANKSTVPARYHQTEEGKENVSEAAKEADSNEYLAAPTVLVRRMRDEIYFMIKPTVQEALEYIGYPGLYFLISLIYWILQAMVFISLEKGRKGF